jgi:hypothetical protein
MAQRMIPGPFTRISNMPDTRSHRGPHPQDAELFAASVWPVLRRAVAELSWLWSRDYATTSALKLVGDRYQLTERQRLAVMRCACSDGALAERQRRHVSPEQLPGRRIDLDGFNVLTTVEAALSGGVVIVGRDGCYRDMASMHGSYRKVTETRPALILIGEVLAELGAAECQWHLDQPVSNSGRLKTIIEQLGAERQWPWRAKLAPDVDAVLARSAYVVASADSAVLDRCAGWSNLAREIIHRRVSNAWLVSLQLIHS